MHNGSVPNRYVVANNGRLAKVGVEHSGVLNIGALTNDDFLDIAPNHRPVPDRRLVTDFDLPHYISTWGYEYLFCLFRHKVFN
jgi:hypothetical protein